MNEPNVTGFRLKDALAALSRAGFSNVSVVATSPPGSISREYDGDSRVLRQKNDTEGSAAELVVSGRYTSDKGA